MSKKILEVKNLKTYFKKGRNGYIKAVDGIDFSIEEGKTLGVVGESGCGKSITSLSIMRLIESPGEIVDGEILFEGKDLLKISEQEMQSYRGNQISMIFQEPMTSLNPVFRIEKQISEVLRIHQGIQPKEAKEKGIELLRLVGIPRPEAVINDYPFQLSGGMRQRIMIAMALACNPKLLIADEPTTALDVTIQSQILSLMNDLKEKLNTGVMLITHDLGVVAQMADHVIVMYAGKVVEDAPVEVIFKNPRHPYTVGLLNSIPSLDTQKERLESIEGNVPDPANLPQGCYFADRCKYATEKCLVAHPPLVEIEPGHKVSCYYSEEVR